MNRRIWSLVGVVAVGGLLAGCGGTTVVSPQTVTVTDTASIDTMFISEAKVLSEKDFGAVPKGDVIGVARSICDKLRDGADRADVANVLVDSYGLEVGVHFLHLSMSAYCPDLLPSGQ